MTRSPPPSAHLPGTAGHARALYGRALAWHREGRGDAAAQTLLELLARWPREVDAMSLLAAVEAQRGRPAEAERLLRNALALQPQRATLHHNLGNALAAQGRMEEALACFERSLALRPDYPPTRVNIARALQALGRVDDALAAIDAALAASPASADALMIRAGLLAEQARRPGADAMAHAHAVQAYRRAEAEGVDADMVRYALAALGTGEAPPTSPAQYVRQLFDRYAPRFDEHLRDRLNYRVPELLVAAALAQVGPEAVGADAARPGLAVVDLGCGTGLCGPLLRPTASRMVGVDLSARMLEGAAARGYDELVCADAVTYLDGQPAASFDLVLAADVVVYIGDIGPLAVAVRRALRPGGMFALSTEPHDGNGYQLQPSRRYAHADAYVDAVARAQGLEPVARHREVLREEHGTPVEGVLHVLRRA